MCTGESDADENSKTLISHFFRLEQLSRQTPQEWNYADAKQLAKEEAKKSRKRKQNGRGPEPGAAHERRNGQPAKYKGTLGTLRNWLTPKKSPTPTDNPAVSETGFPGSAVEAPDVFLWDDGAPLASLRRQSF